MATVQEQLIVIGYLHPYVDREIVDGVLVVEPTVDTSVIDFDLEYQNYLLDKKRTSLTDKVRELRDDIFEAGMPYTFGTTLDYVQTREVDLTILLTLSIKARQALDAGIVDPVFVFRSGNDNEYYLTPQEMLDLTQAVDTFVSTTYRNSWDLKSLIANSTLLELDTIVLAL